MIDTNTANALIAALVQAKTAAAPISNSLQIVTLILAAVAPVISALAVYLMRVAQRDIVELKADVNGKMGALISATSKAAHASGVNDQRTENAMIEAAHAKGVIEQLKATVGSIGQPEVVHQVVSQEIKEQNVDTQTVEETLRKTPPKKI